MTNSAILEFADRMVDEERQCMLHTFEMMMQGNIESMEKINKKVDAPIASYPDYLRGRIDAYKAMYSMVAAMRKTAHKDLKKVYED